ncbi:MAG: hypothetical protein OXT06_14625 [Rhodospirillaceae bacterium]|nr:hypothetical protein [Rhodospirillaceae bacterium]
MFSLFKRKAPPEPRPGFRRIQTFGVGVKKMMVWRPNNFDEVILLAMEDGRLLVMDTDDDGKEFFREIQLPPVMG